MANGSWPQIGPTNHTLVAYQGNDEKGQRIVDRSGHKHAMILDV